MKRPIQQRKPEWLKQRLLAGEQFAGTRKLLADLRLNTVCRSARCPNLQECWSKGTATFMLLGSVCTRNCRFCAVNKSEAPLMPDLHEPDSVALAVKTMRLRHAVLTSVNRDDLPDGGSAHWVAVISAIRNANPGVSIECLIPDFDGVEEHADRVFTERPEVLNHNIETVPSLYAKVRPQADYRRSLGLLERAKRNFRLCTKSGLMVGMGETFEEVRESLADLADTGCDIVTIGQYLQPGEAYLPIERYVAPDEFEAYRREALALGFRHVLSGPFVRSSYHAGEVADAGTVCVDSFRFQPITT